MMIIKTPRSISAALLDGLLTILAWAAFGFLFASGIHSIMTDPEFTATAPAWSRLLPNMQTLLAYALLAACIGLLLSAWACYNAVRFSGLDRRKPTDALQPNALAQHFDISPTQLQILHASRTILIHHTPEGRISMIDFVDEPAATQPFMRLHQ
ncbi:MAG: poly-beta-1,6-N-acetyl-D-glucosamine biosynthesis protein PgaD [Castellaniella sp.]|uniref:poly-beta-1,6-N-acetyl-D-glucosamine biosynthesis protein PgaD n=1 Tax=Castellaniella sp. TaxID=1955812 RepID=UPI002A371B07|nr:poly-beta-1,6-N-acetyl-D-glucosamine biosynthesis protein PgaD [Castellaniella sp.]MDY0308453.1 poly-beta-1,6-N-acetyl-D-glucosamine biosynthesis protein PgaD [Castellaniella sp.]